MKALTKVFHLRELRLNAGLTQSEVANAAGISRRFYVALEVERQEPRVTAALRIARALDATVEEAFGHLDDLRKEATMNPQ